MTPVPPIPTLVEVLPLGGFDHPLTYGTKESLLKEVGSCSYSLGVRYVVLSPLCL